jgi:hypothetical protein
MKERDPQKKLCYYSFTATPKKKTMNINIDLILGIIIS